jgi:hypothetical protein
VAIVALLDMLSIELPSAVHQRENAIRDLE